MHAMVILFGISGGEILILLLLVLLLFGPSKIPEIARMLGKGINEVKKVQREINSEIHRYSGDIEKEARDMDAEIRSDIRELEKEQKAGYTDEEHTREKDTPENKDNQPKVEGNQEEDDDESDLPYPYNQKSRDS